MTVTMTMTMQEKQDTNSILKNINGIFLHKFPKKYIHNWIEQFHFGRKQKYLWKHFYTVKKPLKYRAIDYERQDTCPLLYCTKFDYNVMKVHNIQVNPNLECSTTWM